MDRLKYPVRYLESFDFDEKGNIINEKVPKDVPILIMIQSKGCVHCKKALKDFNDFAKENENRCFCVALLVDGDEEGEKSNKSIVKLIDKNITGYPTFVFYNKNSRIIYNGDRSSADLKRWLQEIESYSYYNQ